MYYTNKVVLELVVKIPSSPLCYHLLSGLLHVADNKKVGRVFCNLAHTFNFLSCWGPEIGLLNSRWTSPFDAHDNGWERKNVGERGRRLSTPIVSLIARPRFSPLARAWNRFPLTSAVPLYRSEFSRYLKWLLPFCTGQLHKHSGKKLFCCRVFLSFYWFSLISPINSG